MALSCFFSLALGPHSQRLATARLRLAALIRHDYLLGVRFR